MLSDSDQLKSLAQLHLKAQFAKSLSSLFGQLWILKSVFIMWVILISSLLLHSITKVSSHSVAMDAAQASQAATEKGLPLGMDASMVDEYASQSKLLQEFVKIPSIGKAWIFNSKNGMHYCCYLVLLNLKVLTIILLICRKHIQGNGFCGPIRSFGQQKEKIPFKFSHFKKCLKVCGFPVVSLPN